jgi:hypothetical protein
VAASSVLGRVFERFLSLRSGWEWQVPHYGDRSVAACTAWVLDRLADSSLRTAPLASGTVPPEAAASAYQSLADDPEHYMTFLLDWGAGQA